MDRLTAERRLEEIDREVVEFLRNAQIEAIQGHSEMINQRIHQRLRESSTNRFSVKNYVTLYWCFNMVPVPIVSYKKLWSDYNINARIYRMISILAMEIQRVFRISVFIIITSCYLHIVLGKFFIFGNKLTFSSNFLKDTFTFILRNNHTIFERLASIQRRQLLNLHDVDATTYSSIIDELLVTTIDYKCQVMGDTLRCFANNSSLIFKFNNVLNNGDVATVTVYLTYALIGNLICLNILYFYGFNILHRNNKFHRYLTQVLTLVWMSIKRLA